jgi:hypothetical protein
VPKTPDVSVGRVFDTPIDAIWFLIPMFAFRGLIHRHFLKELPFEVEKNLSRFASQWTESINRVISEMAADSEHFIRDEIQTVEGLLKNTNSALSELDSAIAQLDRLQSDSQAAAG